MLGWRSLWRDLRSGELRLLMVAVTLAVAALTAVSFFSDRLKSGLERDARQLLGGDAVVVSDNPPTAAWLDQARALGLEQALTLGFPTMGRAPDAQGGATRLVALKAVDQGYPLRGQLRLTRDAQDTTGVPTDTIPAPGEVWVAPPLLDALGLDQLSITEGEGGDTQVGLTKRLNDRLSVGVEQSTQNNTTRAIIDLSATPELKVRGSIDSQGSSRIGVYYEKDY